MGVSIVFFSTWMNQLGRFHVPMDESMNQPITTTWMKPMQDPVLGSSRIFQSIPPFQGRVGDWCRLEKVRSFFNPENDHSWIPPK